MFTRVAHIDALWDSAACHGSFAEYRIVCRALHSTPDSLSVNPARVNEEHRIDRKHENGEYVPSFPGVMRRALLRS